MAIVFMKCIVTSYQHAPALSQYLFVLITRTKNFVLTEHNFPVTFILLTVEVKARRERRKDGREKEGERETPRSCFQVNIWGKVSFIKEWTAIRKPNWAQSLHNWNIAAQNPSLYFSNGKLLFSLILWKKNCESQLFQKWVMKMKTISLCFSFSFWDLKVLVYLGNIVLYIILFVNTNHCYYFAKTIFFFRSVYYVYSGPLSFGSDSVSIHMLSMDFSRHGRLDYFHLHSTLNSTAVNMLIYVPHKPQGSFFGV